MGLALLLDTCKIPGMLYASVTPKATSVTTPETSRLLADRLAGTLLGTALGDAPGLPAEGMTARAIARRFGRIDNFRLLGRTGFVSDDTEQAALVAKALARHPDNLDRCVRDFRRSLLGWFCRLPWGVGMATIRSCARIAVGLHPGRSPIGGRRVCHACRRHRGIFPVLRHFW